MQKQQQLNNTHQDPTNMVLGVTSTANKTCGFIFLPPATPIPKSFSTPLPALGLAYFMTEFVSQHSSSTGEFCGFNDYLPTLCSKSSPLTQIGSAVGLAALSLVQHCPTLTLEARKMQLRALSQIRTALADPVEVKTDSTLVAVVLLGIFEVS